MKHLFFSITPLFFITVSLLAQESPYKFGDISKADFESSLYAHEKGAEAIVLLDYATAHLDFTNTFKIVFNRHVRIRIIKSSGYDYANVEIDYLKDDRIMDLKACTYNLVNDELVSIELSRKDIITEKSSDYEYKKRFTFPQVNEGTIVEYTYTFYKDNIWELMPFTMQREIPVRHAEYHVEYPDYFTYSIKRNGSSLIHEQHSRSKGYVNTTQAYYHVYRWTGINLPAFQAEPHLPALHEHMAGLQFELAAVDFPGASDEFASPTYERFTKRLMLSAAFGKSLDSYLIFMNQVNDIKKHANTEHEIVQNIFKHVQEHMKWNGRNAFLLSQGHKEAYRAGRGNSADINLMLVNMLQTAGIKADPVILSTRAHGTLNKMMAYEGNFNYVICRTLISGKEYLLDATDPDLPMGTLPKYCMNGQGWLVHENQGRFIDLQGNECNSYLDYYNLKLLTNGSIEGNVSLTLDGYAGCEMRKSIKNLGIENFRLSLIEDYGFITYNNIEAKGIDSIGQPVIISFEMKTDTILQSSGSILFFNPLSIFFTDNENPYIKENREYPIDRGWPLYQNFKYMIEIPEDFQIIEIPKSLKLSLPGDAGQFAYGVSTEGNRLIIYGYLRISKTHYNQNEYTALREFYTRIHKKINEMILLQKNDYQQSQL